MNWKNLLVTALVAGLTVMSGCKGRSKKPIIYLYPEGVTEVSVRFADPDAVGLTSSYPDYGATGWSVIAHPDGTLVDQVSGDEFYALYWEGLTDQPDRLQTGSVVAAADTEDFLDTALSRLGLSAREANEFIIYWAPILEESRANFIQDRKSVV